MLGTFGVAIGMVALLIVWLVWLSRLRWWFRVLAVLGGGLLLAGAGMLLEIRGFSGDLLPQLGWRFASDPVPSAIPPQTQVGEAEPPTEATDSDFPQFLGPTRDGSLAGPTLAHDWDRDPPRLRWRRALGEGWSGFAIAAGLALTQEQRGGDEIVSAYDLRSGAPRWAHADPTRFEEPISGAGPRATPTIDADRAFTLGATGLLNALELATGGRLWSRQVILGPDAAPPTYGMAASPLVVGDRVVVPGAGLGRSLLAYDVETGEEVWAAGDDPPAYSSPILVDLDGAQQILLFNARAVVGHDPHDGHVLWRYPWPNETEKVAQPVALPPDRLFVSSGYGVGGKLLRVGRDDAGDWFAEPLWETTAMKAKLSVVVQHAGYLYGLDDGILACVGVDDGQRRWKGGRYGHGQLLRVGGLLLILSERGEVVLVEARPDAHHELARLAAIEGKTWNHPALAGRFLVVRNDREAACYELPLVD